MNKCSECEKEVISELASLQIENDKLKKYVNLLEKDLDIKDELAKVLRDDNEELRNKLELFRGQNERNK